MALSFQELSSSKRSAFLRDMKDDQYPLNSQYRYDIVLQDHGISGGVDADTAWALMQDIRECLDWLKANTDYREV